MEAVTYAVLLVCKTDLTCYSRSDITKLQLRLTGGGTNTAFVTRCIWFATERAYYA